MKPLMNIIKMTFSCLISGSLKSFNKAHNYISVTVNTEYI